MFSGVLLIGVVGVGTVRRFMEKFGDGIDAVVFCVRDKESLAPLPANTEQHDALTKMTEVEAYQRIMPLYFPRSKAEEQVSLPRNSLVFSLSLIRLQWLYCPKTLETKSAKQ